MAHITTHEMAYDIETVLERRLKSLHVPKPKQVAQDITPDIVRMIPSEAFDLKQAWSLGKVFFHGDVDSDTVLDAQHEIVVVHHNIKPDKDITLYLSSFGGDVFAGLALASTIQEVRRAGRKVNVHIQGCAMSMASLIAQVCDNRTIESSAWFMLHNISTYIGKYVKTPFIQDEAEANARLEQEVFKLYTDRTGKSVEYWRNLFHKKDVYLTAAEALEKGLVDEILSAPTYPRKRKPKAA